MHFDVKEIFVNTKPTGYAFTGADVKADVTLDPNLVNVGIAVNF